MIATGAPRSAIDVPSSARPPAPVVRAAIPMYRWDRPDDPSSPRRRHSAGVRLLLERPWVASGDGEQLAVVLAGPDQYPPTDDCGPTSPVGERSDLGRQRARRADRGPMSFPAAAASECRGPARPRPARSIVAAHAVA